MLKCFGPESSMWAYVKTLEICEKCALGDRFFSLCLRSPFQEDSCAPMLGVPKTNILVKTSVSVNKLLYPHHSESAFYCYLLGQSIPNPVLHFRNRCSLIRTSWTLAWNLNFWAGHQAPAFLEPSTTPMTWPGPRLSSLQPVSTEKWNLLLVACSLKC